MTLIIAAVVLGTVFLLGVLVGGEIQKHVLRGHEGTRADRLRELRRRRAEALRRRQLELYGPPPLRAVPGTRPGRDGEPRDGGRDEAEKWWRRHPGGEEPVRRTPDDPSGRHRR